MKRLTQAEIKQHAERLAVKYVAMTSKDSVKILHRAWKQAREMTKGK